MKILYISSVVEDYLSDSILYGLRQKYGAGLIDYPKKESMYVGGKNGEGYGGGFTLWGLLPDIEVDREDAQKKVDEGFYDVIIFSDIYRQLEPYAHWNVYKLFEKTKKYGKKVVFLDGSDDGKVTITEAFKWGTYFKRENPFNYPEVKLIGLSIPECKILTKRPKKTKLLTRHVQVPEAYRIVEVNVMCSQERFGKEEDYYADLATSKYGLTMKKSGWDVPRHMENAANWVVNCIYTKGWEWDGVDWYNRPQDTHPLGFVDMENCVLWSSGEELIAKLKTIDDEKYSEMSKLSHDWALTKTCEKMADYLMKNI